MPAAGILASKRGSTLALALGLTFLIFVITTASLVRVASSYTQVTTRHNQTSALYLAEAGIAKAAAQLAEDSAYSGEKGTQLPTGTFDVTVQPQGGSYVVTATGHANSALRNKPKKTVRATVVPAGGSARISNWREDP